MPLKTYSPKLQVWLNKNILRQKGVSSRYVTAPGELDLTEYLGQGSVVTTNKDLNSPMGGFQITIPDKMEDFSKDSLYGLIEPMDHIEIRMAHNPADYQGSAPLVMRGFVTRVSRRESLEGGRPHRQVVIVGNDYGKAFVNMQVFYYYGYAIGQSLLTSFKFWERYGINKVPLTARDFARTVLNLTNQYLKGIYDSSGQSQADPIKDAIGGINGWFNPLGQVNQYEGPIWGLLSRFADKPWNECFIEDRDQLLDGVDGPHLVVRPAPYRDLYSGELIYQPGVADPGEFEIDESSVVTMTADRSDRDVANFFWVQAPLSLLNQSQAALMAEALSGGAQDVLMSGYPNNDRTLYGDRAMKLTTWLDGESEPSPARPGKDLPEAQQAAANQKFLTWMHHRRKVLGLMNRDNVVFENGTMELKGNERARVGKYLLLKRGAITSRHYVTGVTHEYAVLSHFKTSLSYIRGTGFYERAKAEDSPWLSEGRRGPYDA